MSLGGEERKAHRAADQQRVGELAEAVDHGDLVGHLGPAEDGHQRAGRVLEHTGKRLNLTLEQVSRGAVFEQLGHALGRGMGAVGGAESVVDVHVGEGGHRRCQLRIVLGLAGLIADVLEHEDVARCEVVGKRLDIVSHDSGRQRDVGAGQLGKPVGRGPQR